MLVSRIVSGGQAGVDRAALDFAIANDIPYGGWVPKRGRTEDGIDLLASYPALQELGTSDYPTRTRMNVESSTATLIVCPRDLLHRSRGTLLTIRCAKQAERPLFVADDLAPSKVRDWLDKTVRSEGGLVLNVAGPRASGWDEGYATTEHLLAQAIGPGPAAP